MRTLAILFLVFAAGSAIAQVEVECVLDREIRFQGACNYGGGDGAGGMPANGDCDYPHRAYAVFRLEDFPVEYSGVTLFLNMKAAFGSRGGAVQVSAIGEDQVEIHWDFDFEKPFVYLGQLVTESELYELHGIDVSDAIDVMRAAGAAYVVFKFHVLSSSDYLVIATTENVDVAGPKLVFNQPVPNDGAGLDDLKALFR